MDYSGINLEDLFYDRTRNLSGIEEFDEISDLSCPSQGSFVQFDSKDLTLETDNNYLNIIPIGVNNLTASFNMSYEVVEEEAQKIVNFLESKEGHEPVNFDTDPTVYRTANGYCTNYSLNQTEANNYTVTAVIDVTEAANHFSWTGLNFLNPDPRSSSYKANRWKYKKDDVVYDQREEGLYKDRMNSFYYCTKDHDSSDDTVDYLRDSEYFTQDFFWAPDVGQSNNVEIDVSRFGDKNGLTVRRKIKDNISTFPINYEFKNITTKQLKAMLHFLESKGGYKRFKHQINGVYNRPKIFVCKTWRHTWDTYDSHTLQVTFEEDPLGVYPKRKTVKPEDVYTTVSSFTLDSLQLSGSIPNNWISGQSNYNFLTLGVSCQSIGDNAFMDCSGIRDDIIMPSTIQTIGVNAFKNCSEVTNLVISRGVDVISASAFEGCSSITGDLVIPDSATLIGARAFKNCLSYNGDISIGLDVTGIGDEAFRGCSKINGELILPSGLLEIGDYAFAGIGAFGRLYIPDTVTSIGPRAFQNCKFIGNSVTVESGVQTIGGYAFNNCKAVQKLQFKGQQAPASVNINAFQGLTSLNTRNGKKIIYAPLGAAGYDIAPWTDFEIVYQR